MRTSLATAKSPNRQFKSLVPIQDLLTTSGVYNRDTQSTNINCANQYFGMSQCPATMTCYRMPVNFSTIPGTRGIASNRHVIFLIQPCIDRLQPAHGLKLHNLIPRSLQFSDAGCKSSTTLICALITSDFPYDIVPGAGREGGCKGISHLAS